VETPIRLVDVLAPLGADPDGERSPFYTGLGAGVALVDLDADRDLDLLVGAELGTVRAFRNGGDLGFRDDTARHGLGGIRHATAFALGDCDGDEKLEILVSRSDRNVLLAPGQDGWVRLDGGDLSADPQHGLSAEFVDLDGDGDLDVFQAIYQPEDHRHAGAVPRAYFNDGACSFERRDAIGFDPGMAVDFAFLDADADGDPDVLVSNDFGMLNGAGALYENLGGRFRRTSAIDGAFMGMGALVADLDHDGRFEVLVTNIGRNPWFHNEGPLILVDRSREKKLGGTWYIDRQQDPLTLPYFDPESPNSAERNMARFVRDYLDTRPADEQAFVVTSWSANAVDFDADGWLDLFLTRGFAGITSLPEGRRQRLGLIQQRPGGEFVDVSAAAVGEDPGTFKGSGVGDLDGDGLPDLVVFDHRFGNLTPRHRILHNRSDAGGWIRVDLRGRAPNTWALGAVVTVRLGQRPVMQRRTLHGGVYSASADALFFGIGDATSVDVEVAWPGGAGATRVEAVPAGSRVLVRQDGETEFELPN
jgi:hypothetical protein